MHFIGLVYPFLFYNGHLFIGLNLASAALVSDLVSSINFGYVECPLSSGLSGKS